MTSTLRETPHLFADWDQISRRLLSRRRLVIFLDFDGTLVRIAPTPDQVQVEERTREALRKLAHRPDVTLAVISGRRRAELQRYVRLPELTYLGLYGWETNGNMSFPGPIREALAGTIVDLVARLPKHSRVWVEPKGETFSIHLLRASAKARQQVEKIVKSLLARQRGTLKLMTNLRDLEVTPVSLGDKGEAVHKFLAAPGRRGALPVYFGDDFSDEPGFAASRAGISVLVGVRRRTRAKFSVRGPAEVTEALSRMEEVIRWRQ